MKTKRTSNAPEVGQGDKALKEFLSRSFDETFPMVVSGDHDALTVLLFAVANEYERRRKFPTTSRVLKKWADTITEAMKDNVHEGSQLPFNG